MKGNGGYVRTAHGLSDASPRNYRRAGVVGVRGRVDSPGPRILFRFKGWLVRWGVSRLVVYTMNSLALVSNSSRLAMTFNYLPSYGAPGRSPTADDRRAMQTNVLDYLLRDDVLIDRHPPWVGSSLSLPFLERVTALQCI